MFISIFSAVESGVIYAIMALGVYLSFRVLDFPDLTVDGSFVTGAAIGAVALINGSSPIVAILLAAIAGFIAGCITGILHTKGKINPLLSGILMMTALYSVNLRIMESSTISLLHEVTIFKQLSTFWNDLGVNDFLNSIFSAIGLKQSPSTWSTLIAMFIFTLIIKFLTDYFLKTEVGLAIRATGDNQRMIRSFSANTDFLIILGLGISNGLVALSGGLIAQYGGFADVGMGVGMIIIGLASVIIGEALFGTKTIGRTTIAVIFGAIIYRIVVTLALRANFLNLDTGDMKLITAVLVIVALVTPQIIQNHREKKRRQQKRAILERENEVEGAS